MNRYMGDVESFSYIYFCISVAQSAWQSVDIMGSKYLLPLIYEATPIKVEVTEIKEQPV